MPATFQFARIPHTHFGLGCAAKLESVISRFGGAVLAVTGQAALRSRAWRGFESAMRDRGRPLYHMLLSGEPSPEYIDETVSDNRERGIGVVIGWGGGSAVDAGKAVSAMLVRKEPVINFLEDVGMKPLPDGAKVPYVAVPTTAGTGSEATKNAVLSHVGECGFKKSLRHDNFVPDFAIIDPELALTCPPAITAACGMDAFTQLLEGYVSPAASPMTDALALSGIEAAAACLERAVQYGGTDTDARSGMAYAAFLSGVVLANAGLGIVHGLASPIGGYFDIPHGVVCGTLIAAATEANRRKLRDAGDADHPALIKYGRAGEILAGRAASDCHTGCDWLIERLWALTESLGLPRLGKFGVGEDDLDKILNGTANKNNPISLERSEIAALVRSRL